MDYKFPLAQDGYFERGMHRAVPTSLVDAMELGFADATAAGRIPPYSRKFGVPEFEEVEDHYDRIDDAYNAIGIVEHRIRRLPHGVAVTPADACAAFTMLEILRIGTEENHIIADEILLLIASRAGFAGVLDRFRAMSKYYA